MSVMHTCKFLTSLVPKTEMTLMQKEGAEHKLLDSMLLVCETMNTPSENFIIFVDQNIKLSHRNINVAVWSID